MPRTRPMQFYLNGERQGLYVFTERINEEFFEARFGHADFDIDKRRHSHSIASLGQTHQAVYDGQCRRRRRFAESHELGTYGVVLCDDRCRPFGRARSCAIVAIRAARWFWVTWDLDHSFMDVYRAAPQPWLLDTYKTDSFE